MSHFGNFNGMNNQNQRMGSNFVQEEIQNHKNKLNDFIIKLNNTHHLEEEISLNNSIKIESECLFSLLNIKGNELNQIIFKNNNFLGSHFAQNINNMNNNFNNNIQNPGNMSNNINDTMEEEWMKGFKMGVESIYNNDNNEEISKGPKLNITFKTTWNTSTFLTIDYGTPIDEVLKKYLRVIKRPDLIGDKNNKLVFLFNACKLRFGDKTPVKLFFKNIPNPKVIVNDISNLIGG